MIKCFTNVDERCDKLLEPREGEGHEADEMCGGDDSSTHAHAHPRHTHPHSAQLHAHHAALIQPCTECVDRSSGLRKL